MRAALIVVVLLATVSLILCEDNVVAPLVGPDQVVPEEVLTEDEARAGTERQNPLDMSDDESDHEAMKHIEADTLGRNPITGAKMSKGNNGMSGADHLRYDPVMGRNFVKPPGYTTHDAQLTPGGPDMGGGKYYLGSGRRRIGAGFGRRRRAVEIPETKAQKQADQKRLGAIFKDPVKMKKLLRFAHRRTSSYGEDEIKDRTNMIKNLKAKAKNPMKGLTRAQLLKYTREMMGIQSGPTFYEHNNYGGRSLTTPSSVKDIEATGKMDNNDVSSLKVPSGYVVELYTEKNYAGQRLLIAGPSSIWGLKTRGLTLHSGVNSGGGSGPDKMTIIKGYRSYHTTWDNEAASIKITKYEYVVFPPKQKCTKECGVDNYEYTGSIGCQRSGGLQKKKVFAINPTSNECARLKLSEPRIPKKRCQGTAACTEFKTSKPTARCTTTCGFSGDTKHGKVWCQLRNRRASDPTIPKEASASRVAAGSHVTDGKCLYWNLPKPPKPIKVCRATKRCVHWVRRFTGSCPTSCGQGSSRIFTSNFCVADHGGSAGRSECNFWRKPQPARQSRYCGATGECPLPHGSCCWMVMRQTSRTSCARCIGGHSFEWAWKCGGSRRCD